MQDSSSAGEFWPDDEVPATLLPALRSIFDEMVPFLAACGAGAQDTPVVAGVQRKAIRIPRREFVIRCPGARTPAGGYYPVWMAQRLLEALRR